MRIDDIKSRIDVDLNRLNDASEADAKESLVVTILIPAKYIGKIELSVNAGTVNITDIENEKSSVNENCFILPPNNTEVPIEAATIAANIKTEITIYLGLIV